MHPASPKPKPARETVAGFVVKASPRTGVDAARSLRDMANDFTLTGVTDIADCLIAWQERYVSEASMKRYKRACAWTMDETAKRVATRMPAVMDRVLDRPTPWMKRAFQ